DHAEALRQYIEGLRTNPAEKYVYQKKITNALVLLGRRDDAVDLLDHMIPEHREDQELRALRAILLTQSGNRNKIQSAIKEFEQLVKERPQDFVVRYNFGKAYLASGDLGLAQAQFLAAIQQDSSFLEPYLALAQMAEQKQDFREVLRLAKRTLELDA